MDDLKNYKLIFFGSSRFYSPHRVVNIDNNGKILFYCIKPRSLVEIQNHHQILDSQLDLMRLYNLLKRNNNGTYQTNFPVLTVDQFDDLMNFTRIIAEKLYFHIKTSLIDLIKQYLEEYGGNNPYSFIFSYLFDGKVWSFLMDATNPVSNNNEDESILWSGLFWAVVNKREFSCGTNSWTDGNYTFMVNHSDSNKQIITTLYNDNYTIGSLLQDISPDFIVRDKIKQDHLRSLHLIDHNGKLTLIKIKNNSPLLSLSNDLAKSIADYFFKTIDLTKLKELIPVKTEIDLITILYHEILWDLMEIIESNQLIYRPSIFNPINDNNNYDFREIIFCIED
ncbi:MAG: hypothetical protein OEZ01_18015 [Candidatus Heimdallarchaeota archaeon]|nr:hypothetical protein [Candidatus Heimdallarchaeota archaeon]MDH5647911.1 hypothetical protein [Candidatus Heimdallarchaeota archaeon]